jgi:hypothetical protein
MPPDHVLDRTGLVSFLRAELVGPAPTGEPIDCAHDIVFEDAAQGYQPRVQAGSNEEILQRDPPGRRYGIGALYPLGREADDDDVDPEASDVVEGEPQVLSDSATDDLNHVAQRARRGLRAEEEEVDLSSANDYCQSAMAVSFLCDFSNGSLVEISLSAGRYRPKRVRVGSRDRVWWLRSPVSYRAEFNSRELLGDGNRVASRIVDGPGFEHLDLRVEVFSRPHGGRDRRLLTVCVVNRTQATRPLDEYTLFQVAFEASVSDRGTRELILPYPVHPQELQDEEEQSIELLYRHSLTFAVGHGCAADWVTENAVKASKVVAVPFPVVETPSITPEILKEDGSPLEVSMELIAGLVNGEDGLSLLESVVERYESWIADREEELQGLNARYRAASTSHMTACRRAATRMRDGLALLRADPQVARAFRLANRAVLVQQVNGARVVGTVSLDEATRTSVFQPPYRPPDLENLPPELGRWRPFQIAFLLMALRGIADHGSLDRRTVDLLWFPTGGGKTEAYLGLAAFTMFLRRLKNPRDVGTDVVMRYTLRLLTAQQFQRAARMVCAMEAIRREVPRDLGDASFSIGIWLGGSTTPNTRRDALGVLRKLQQNRHDAENQFLIDRCPWCKAPIGPVTLKIRGRDEYRVLGIEQRGPTVALFCPDARCPFNSGLPVQVIDEDLYDSPPSFVIGTIDKFAVLAWKSEARALFGLGPDGDRVASPPTLIIQDELHLISGPLGSMAGLFEVLVEELCTDRRAAVRSPKVICSTATIRRYRDQVRALYMRADVALFPPPGLSVADSFFARYATEPDGSLSPGRLYVGVHAPALGSLQTAQVRTLTALLQAPTPLGPEDRDPWWTLMVFFNSLRELGGTLSLIQSDIPDYLRVMKGRLGISWDAVRRLYHILELTSRLQSDEVTEAISKLEQSTTTAQYPVDICLASSMIEVGIDIDRLSLMAVVGQPKTTAQYIQVTGRVGRRWWERPGLVVTIYTASKARDRSHYEKFRSYHERLYAQVEPTSVTPFSRPVLERALHATIVGYVRQAGDRASAASPRPFPRDLVGALRDLLAARADFVDPAENETLQRVFDRRVNEWRSWDPRFWTGQNEYEAPLLRAAGAYCDPIRAQRSWATPTSLRNVDLECQAEITPLYGAAQAGDDNA